MKQFQTTYREPMVFRQTVAIWQNWHEQHGAGAVLIHIFADAVPMQDVKDLCDIIEEIMPSAQYVGASANGNLYGGVISSESIVITCTIFESKSSFIEVGQYIIEDSDVDKFQNELNQSISPLKGVKAAEVLMTLGSIPVNPVCNVLDSLPEDVIIFGGCAFGDNEHLPYTFKKGGAMRDGSVVVIFIGGEEVSVFATYIMGWKPIGMPLEVTRADHNVIYELSGVPAYEVYNRYLKIPNDDNIFYNALEFPFAVDHRDGIVLRHALSCGQDGSIVMNASIYEGSILHITYGDPETILRSVSEGRESIEEFGPEVISIYDCFGRKTFWGDFEASRETKPFNSIAPTYGFCTVGELIRGKSGVTQHSLSMVVAGMREGAPKRRDDADELNYNIKSSEKTVSLVSRLANFIDTTTSELIEVNHRLSVIAITDQLTNLYNRGEIQRRITDRIQKCMYDPMGERATSLIMMDLDDFKKVNDTYGHKEGDNVLRSVSSVILKSVNELGIGASPGRWGGEEFMIMLPGMDEEEAAKFAEQLRRMIEQLKFEESGKKTASFGVAQARAGERPDPLASRTDAALYRAKTSGKNRVVAD